MKNLAISFVVLVFLISCSKENRMLTQIFPDGSCSREFVSSPDSAFMVGDTSHNPFPVKIDPSWKISYYLPGNTHKVYSKWPLKKWDNLGDTSMKTNAVISIKKKFSSIAALQDSFRFDHSNWVKIRPRISFEKKFKWFYTTYTYREVYPQSNSRKNTTVPIEKYLSKQELELYFTENPKFEAGLTGMEIKDQLDNIDHKYNEWIKRNLFEEVFTRYINAIKKNEPDNPYLERIITSKDTLWGIFSKDDALNCDFQKVLEKHFNNKKLFATVNLENDINAKMEKYTEFTSAAFHTQIQYQLLMPGKVIETSSRHSQGDTLCWKVDAYRFFFNDYEIYAKSKVANIWAFIISGIFMIAVAFSFLIKRK